MHCENKLPNVRFVILESSKPENTTTRNDATSAENEDFINDFPDEIVPLENVTVKFLLPEKQVVAQVYPNRMAMGDVKKDIGRKFEVDTQWLRLKQCDRNISDDCLLLETESDDFGIHEFALELDLELFEPDPALIDPLFPKLDLNIYYDKYRLPDFITVNIPAEDTGDGNPKNIIVEIQNKTIAKPFLCGYKDKRTGLEYLDAYTQTGPYYHKSKYNKYNSRDTQTVVHKQKEIETMHDQSSQCYHDENNILHVLPTIDYTIIPRKFQTYAQKMRVDNKVEKVRLIQRNWRRFLIVRFMKEAAAKYRRFVDSDKKIEAQYQEENLRRIKLEERAKKFPTSKMDFELLFGEVTKWKKAEMKRIVSMYDGAARISEINLLLDKEIQLLNAIERQRVIVFKALEDLQEEKLLAAMGKPIKWIGYKDRVIHLDLLRTQRARFLNEIYKDLQKPLATKERLELIDKVEDILIKEQDFPQILELLDMYAREKNLLLYTKLCNVDILRQRQNILFRNLIKFRTDSKAEKTNKKMCVVCKKVKSYDNFAIRARQDKVTTCQKCYNLVPPSMDSNVYMPILRAVHRDERKKRASASFAFLMQVDDVRHLIDEIWHGHSILSKTDDLTRLRLPRWIKSEDWAPWNCVCLTEDETRNHYELTTPLEEVYSPKLMLEIGNRLRLARIDFRKLAAVATEFVETKEWFSTGLNKQRIPM